MRIIHKCFIVGMILPLSLQANGVTYCPSTPVGAIVRKQKLDKERHELEQIRCRKKHRSNKRRNHRSEKKQKEVLDKIEKQNEEIIKLLSK